MMISGPKERRNVIGIAMSHVDDLVITGSAERIGFSAEQIKINQQ